MALENIGFVIYNLLSLTNTHKCKVAVLVHSQRNSYKTNKKYILCIQTFPELNIHALKSFYERNIER